MKIERDPKLFPSKLKVTVDEVEYEWVGGYGVVIRSIETKPLPLGHLRLLGSRLFRVAKVDEVETPWPLSNDHAIGWAPVDKMDCEWITHFQHDLFRLRPLSISEDEEENDDEESIGGIPGDYTKPAERYAHNLQREFTSEKPSTLRNET